MVALTPATAGSSLVALSAAITDKPTTKASTIATIASPRARDAVDLLCM
jgi:hypothetical protein